MENLNSVNLLSFFNCLCCAFQLLFLFQRHQRVPCIGFKLAKVIIHTVFPSIRPMFPGVHNVNHSISHFEFSLIWSK